MPTTAELLELGVSHHQSGRLRDAERIYRQILEADPGHADAWHLIGLVAFQGRRFEQAIDFIRHSLEINPHFAEAYSNLGAAFFELGMLTEAADCHERAAALNPGYAGAHFNLGNVRRELGNLDAAIQSYQRAIQLDPSTPDAFFSLGMALRERGHLDEAATAYIKALQLRPNDAEAYSNLGNVLKAQGRLDEAVKYYDCALEVRTAHAGARFNRAVVALLRGDFESGWRDFESRLNRSAPKYAHFAQPRWDGTQAEGRSILLCAEQGFGDTIQFVRYAALAKRLRGKVVVECQPELISLLANAPGIDQLIPAGVELPDFDSYSPLLSLPLLFKTTLNDIPAQVPYLFASPSLIDKWHRRLNGLDGLKVGIAWQGSTGYQEDRERSIALKHFRALSQVPGVHLISLQKGYGTEQLAECDASFSVIDFGDELDQIAGPFMDTAAMIQCLDLVVTSDTAIAHVAGALGAPVSVALPFVPDWRWLLDRSDSPWYPTMRLFRQKSPGDWTVPFAEIKAQLQQLAAAR